MQPEMAVWWEQESSSGGITETEASSQESGKGVAEVARTSNRKDCALQV